eukprot:g22533.t1
MIEKLLSLLEKHIREVKARDLDETEDELMRMVYFDKVLLEGTSCAMVCLSKLMFRVGAMISRRVGNVAANIPHTMFCVSVRDTANYLLFTALNVVLCSAATHVLRIINI